MVSGATRTLEVGSPAGVLGTRVRQPSRRSPGQGAWMLVACYVGLTALGARYGGGGDIFELAFPVMSGVVGFALYRSHPRWYLGFTWWLWFSAAFVRRVADYYGGWHATSPILLAPYIVTAISGLTLLSDVRAMRRRTLYPFFLLLAGLTYGYVVGAVRFGPYAATLGLVTWLPPVLLGFYVASQPHLYAELGTATRRTMGWAVVALGAYGIGQYFDPPVWDRAWVLNAQMASVGIPEPYSLHVFGTLNSAGPFAFVMMIGVIMLVGGKARLRWAVAIPGYVAMLLSLVRASWVGVAVGLLAYVRFAKSGRRVKTVVVLMVVAAVVAELAATPSLARAILPRAATLSRLDEDVSFRSRREQYSQAGELMATSLVGSGLGSIGPAAATRSAEGPSVGFDSGLLEMVYSLGVVGGTLYGAGIALLAVRVLGTRRATADAAELALRAASASALTVALAGNAFVGVSGAMLLGVVGLATAAEGVRATRRPAAEMSIGVAG